MKQLKNNLRELLKYPSAIFGSIIVLALIISAIVVIIKIPYNEAISTWRGGEAVVGKNPRNVPPKYFNWFRKDKLVESLDLREGDEGVLITEEVTEGGTPIKTVIFEIDYDYKSFPTELVVYFTSEYVEKQPFVNIKWITPAEEEIRVGGFAIGKTHTYPLNQDEKLKKRLGNVNANIGLFLDPEVEQQVPVPGIYKLVIETITFEPESTVNAEFVMHGQVFGWAGTDHMRRDLLLPILWGIPIALAFGLCVDHDHCSHWHLVRRYCGRNHSAYHRDQSGFTIPLNPDHDWYILFAEHLDYFGSYRGIEHLYGWNQTISGNIHAG